MSSHTQEEQVSITEADQHTTTKILSKANKSFKQENRCSGCGVHGEHRVNPKPPKCPTLRNIQGVVDLVSEILEKNEALRQWERKHHTLTEKCQHLETDLKDHQEKSATDLKDLQRKSAKEVDDLQYKHEMELLDFRYKAAREFNDFKEKAAKERSDLEVKYDMALVNSQAQAAKAAKVFSDLKEKTAKDLSDLQLKYDMALDELESRKRRTRRQNTEVHKYRLMLLDMKKSSELKAVQGSRKERTNDA
ncbi:hypothetical protein N7532_003332 [Penicillium argentinense]|uniref:Uncharacterized protein n=1 Tax=Penicillium argentinense TaxID=1131581 RepID=A0A9W9FMA2_9EURO|nr:uncharacterized protein N7532_003332 [Penicillium argentinense]KAJ5102803.1 hypothetical protein N7532_003332 [Penicillium argentinense]